MTREAKGRILSNPPFAVRFKEYRTIVGFYWPLLALLAVAVLAPFVTLR